jgi:catechol 2,3-dioxygenase-like lactoylglutathione lyase family enzyme
MAMARIEKVCPLFPSADVAKAAVWYRDKLGFKIGNVYPDHGYAIVHRDGIEIHFYACDDRKVAENTSAYFRPDDIDGLHDTMTGAREGGRISDIRDRDWDMREFYVWDPDGNLLKFGVPARAVAAE